MGLFPRVFAPAANNSGQLNGRRKSSVSDRLSVYVNAVARQVDDPIREPFVVDRNYNIITPEPAQK